MTASSLFFDGKLFFKPGSYSIVDASGLAQIGLGASGTVAVIGTATGGRPADTMSEASEFLRVTRPGKENELFTAGNLLEAIPMLFSPCNDQDIPGGAQLIIPMKVNPDTQSTATFANGSGDSLVLTSVDYGEEQNQIQVEISTGTNQGKQIVVTMEDIIQTGDDIGGDPFFTCIYRPATGAGGVGWETMTMSVLTGGQVRANGTFAQAGLDSALTTTLAGAYTAISSNAGDTTQTLTVYGLKSGVPTRVQVTMNGTSAVSLGSGWDATGIKGAILSAVGAGNITIRDSAVTTELTITAGQVQGAAIKTSSFFVKGALTQVSSGASTNRVWYIGRNSSGTVVIDRLALTGTSPVTSAVTTLVTLEAIVFGEVEAAQTVTISGKALETTASTQNTLRKVSDFVNARQVPNSPDPYGFDLTITTTRTTFDVSLLDTVSGEDIFSPVEAEFTADLNELVEFINNNMDLVTAEAASGAIGVPDNTTQPVFLAGGTTVAASTGDWQYAIDLCKKMRINTIVPLTADPAVHAYLKTHCAYMCGVGKSERDGVVGLMNAGLTDLASKTEIQEQILDLNTRHIRAVAQSVDLFNKAGELTTFDPPFHACLVAGGQAGSPVGTPLTFKIPNVLDFHQDDSWSPVDDAEEMIQSGLMFMEEVDGIGRRWVRNITTHLSSSNIAFTEASVNQAVNFAVYNFRTNMEVSVGKKGFSGTINAAKAVALGTLGLLVDQEILTQYRGLSVDLVVDVLEVSVEIAPVIPINFVRNVLHLVTVRQSAA